MTLNPEVQAKAQKEIDTMMGPDQLPETSDRPNLPYVEAVVKEVLRWNPGFPIRAFLRYISYSSHHLSFNLHPYSDSHSSFGHEG